MLLLAYYYRNYSLRPYNTHLLRRHAIIIHCQQIHTFTNGTNAATQFSKRLLWSRGLENNYCFIRGGEKMLMRCDWLQQKGGRQSLAFTIQISPQKCRQKQEIDTKDLFAIRLESEKSNKRGIAIVE